MTILLKEVFPIENLGDYKVHFAKWNQKNQPLDVQFWKQLLLTRGDQGLNRN